MLAPLHDMPVWHLNYKGKFLTIGHWPHGFITADQVQAGHLSRFVDSGVCHVFVIDIHLDVQRQHDRAVLTKVRACAILMMFFSVVIVPC